MKKERTWDPGKIQHKGAKDGGEREARDQAKDTGGHPEPSEAPEERTPRRQKTRTPAGAKHTVTRQFIHRTGV